MPIDASQPIMFYDGGCALCRREVALYRWLDRQQRIQWLDITHRPQVLTAFGIELDSAMRELHVIDARGQTQTGVDAFITLWQSMSGFGWLARLARQQRVYRLLEGGYDRFARRRYRKRCKGGSCGVG